MIKKRLVRFGKGTSDLFEELAKFQNLPKGDENIRMGQVTGNVLYLYSILSRVAKAKGGAKITIEMNGEVVVKGKDLKAFLLKMRRYPPGR